MSTSKSTSTESSHAWFGEELAEGGQFARPSPSPVADFERFVQVQEHDLDRLGLAIPAMYARWMEETEYAFLRSRGLSVSLTDSRGRYGFPRTRVQLEVSAPARRGDELRVGLWLGGTDGKHLHYQFVIERRAGIFSEFGLPSGSWETSSRGGFQLACCRFPPEALPYAIPIPDLILERLGLEAV